jgi:hypothetical protein
MKPSAASQDRLMPHSLVAALFGAVSLTFIAWNSIDIHIGFQVLSSCSQRD